MKKVEYMQKKDLFQIRLKEHIDELQQIYMYLYNDEQKFQLLCETIKYFYEQRPEMLRQRDSTKQKDWYKKNDMIGMSFYVDKFAGNLTGVTEKLSYLEQANVTYIHLMPCMEEKKEFFSFDEGKKAFEQADEFWDLTKKCHERDICVSVDFALNHTSDEHAWAKKAKEGQEEYQQRYYFFDHYGTPALYERTMEQLYPTTDPGNFTWIREAKSYVMTTFHKNEWDLNYSNPIVFQEMITQFLSLANLGVDIVQLGEIAYLWKEINTPCCNLPQVHMIMRMIRIIDEIVCPSVLLFGKVDMIPQKVVSYFGTEEKPECHMLHNATLMATIWNTVATRDTRLLKNQLDFLASAFGSGVFVNELRNHDEICWNLDYDALRSWGMEKEPHKHYLNEFFSGKTEQSFSCAELYIESLYFNDAKVCATTASLCGIEQALKEQDEEKLKRAIQLHKMLYAFLMMQRGVPVICSGDEIGQRNDNSYKKDAKKRQDFRWTHRGQMDWDAASRISDKDSVEGKLFQNICKIEEIRKREAVYASDAKCYTVSTGDDRLLCVVRENEKDKIIGLFNFSEEQRIAWIDEQDDLYRDIVTEEVVRASALTLGAYDFMLLKRMNLARSRTKREVPQKPKGLKAGPPKGVKPKMWQPPVYPSDAELKNKEEKKENVAKAATTKAKEIEKDTKKTIKNEIKESKEARKSKTKEAKKTSEKLRSKKEDEEDAKKETKLSVKEAVELAKKKIAAEGRKKKK